MNYNYITSAAMDVGLALCAIVIFFCITLPGGAMPNWWGVTVTTNTVDAGGTAVRYVPASGQSFGPATWKW
jgi:hypothetical protein